MSDEMHQSRRMVYDEVAQMIQAVCGPDSVVYSGVSRVVRSGRIDDRDRFLQLVENLAPLQAGALRDLLRKRVSVTEREIQRLQRRLTGKFDFNEWNLSSGSSESAASEAVLKSGVMLRQAEEYRRVLERIE